MTCHAEDHITGFGCCFWDLVSCSPSWPQTYCVAKVGFELPVFMSPHFWGYRNTAMLSLPPTQTHRHRHRTQIQTYTHAYTFISFCIFSGEKSILESLSLGTCLSFCRGSPISPSRWTFWGHQLLSHWSHNTDFFLGCAEGHGGSPHQRSALSVLGLRSILTLPEDDIRPPCLRAQCQKPF